ncbi:MAG: pimeloyl-ACP methyl ester carboxylesterase, partial [Verrucomicrobiales bacterium]
TLRTQLDMFQKVFDRLAEHADVIAVDYPGHGFSDIPDAAYTPELFRKYVAGFLDALDLNEVTVVGESIGASIGLQLAGEKNPRISRVIAINPYDYGRGRGVMRSSLAAKVFMGIANVPVIGITTWRLRFFPAHVSVMKGGISNRGAIPDSLMKEMYHVGSRPGHLKAFISLIRHFPDWESDRSVYANIEIPVTLVYGERDWSTAAERLANESEIPNAKRIDIAGAGHFLSIDAPDQAVTTITETTAS